jgi:hypothetical protein
MSRVLRIELRRSAAVWGALVLVAAGALIMLGEPPGWLSGWMSVAATQRTEVLIVWPLALALGAWQARTRHLARMAELASTTALPAWRRVLPVTTALGLGAAGAYLAVTMAAVLRFASGAAYHPPAVFGVIAVGVLAMVAAVCLGLALGRLLPYAVTAPALAVAGLALLMGAQAAAERQPWLTHALSPALPRTLFTIEDLDLLAISPQVSAAQATWLGALAVTGAALFAAGDRRSRLAALLPAVLGAGIALLMVPRGVAAPGVSFDRTAAELVCAAGEPRVCVARAHAAGLPALIPLVREGLVVLARLPGAPTTAVEDATPWGEQSRPAPGTVLLPTVDTSYDTPLARTAFVRSMVRAHLDPAGCGGWAASAAIGWLTGRDPEPSGDATYDDRVRSLRKALDGLPEAEAVRRVEALRTAAAAGCSGDLDRLLLTGRPA